MNSSLVLKATSSRGYAHHWQLQTTGVGRRALVQAQNLRDLRERIIPDFMKAAGINDFRAQGMRLVIDAPSVSRPVDIHLITGQAVPNFNPQDWRTPASTAWDPEAKGAFFEKSAEAAEQGLARMAFGNPLYLTKGIEPLFGVADGDPKAATHFLMMATERFGTMADQGFDLKLWQHAFFGAELILYGLKNEEDPVRYVANFGAGFQQGPRVHLHVMSRPEGFFSIFPQDYGFGIKPDGTIDAPEGFSPLRLIIGLIDRRAQVKGFGNKEVALRKALDQHIFSRLFLLDRALSGQS